MTSQPVIPFSDGHSIPQVGLGVWQTPNDVAVTAVKAALETGYRHIDTAAIYENEAGVGAGIRAAGLAREEIFVTTKVWNADQGFDQTLKAAEVSLKRLRLEHVDLYLIHWPAPREGLFVDTWRALIRLKEVGRVRSIGVSGPNISTGSSARPA
jgi:2,5-diketo-D-gluconate reductase A